MLILHFDNTPQLKPDNAISKEQQTIASLAYRLWEEQGRPEGRDREHWLRAEQQVRSFAPSASPPASAPKKSEGKGARRHSA